MQKVKNLTGQKFGSLTVIKRAGRNKHKHILWLCKCDCGNFKNILACSLSSGRTTSCGCFRDSNNRRIQTSHGLSKTSTYHIWTGMRSRCNNPKDPGYKYYGGRGIKVCKIWDKYENFLKDMGKRPEGKTLDRVDNDGNYSPENCRWAGSIEQHRNNRNCKLSELKVVIIKKLLKESSLKTQDIAEIFGVSRSTLYYVASGRTWSDVVYSEVS